MRIDRIEKSKHKQERVLVFLEDETLLRVTGAELLRFGLYKGMDVPPELVVELQAAAQKSELKQPAARMASCMGASLLESSRAKWPGSGSGSNSPAELDSGASFMPAHSAICV